jgi:Ca2+-binding EF-hand superfamily protein
MRKLWAGFGSALLTFAPLHAIAQDDGSTPVPTSQSTGDTDPDLGSHIRAGAPQGPKPIERKQFDEAVAKLFKQADSNTDGTITLAEFNAVIEARKTAAIGARFAAMDTDRDKSISFDEFVRWQRSLGSAVLSDSAIGGSLAIVPEDIRYDPGRSDNDKLIARLIEPLYATLLVAANADYDAGVSLAELDAYEGKRFDAADTNRDGFLTHEEIGIYLPKIGEGADAEGSGGFGGERGGRGRPRG